MEIKESITLRDILRIFFSHKVFFIVFPVVLAVSAYIGNELQTGKYEASVKMFLKAEKTTESNFYKGIGAADLIADHSGLLKSNIVLNRVIKALKLDERPADFEKRYASPLKKALIDYRFKERGVQPDAETGFNSALSTLNGNIRMIPQGTSRLFIIKVMDYDRGQVAKIANSVSRSYIIFDLEQQIEELKLKYGEKHSVVLQLKDYIEDFKKTLHGELIPDMEAIGPASIKIVAQAEGSFKKKGVSKNLLMIFAFFSGIFLAIALSTVIELSDQTFKLPKTIVEELNVPLLCSLPKRKPRENILLNGSNFGTTDYLKSFQPLAEQLPLTMRGEDLKTLLITDAEGSRETTIISANISIYLAQITGRKVLIIDADLRNSSLSKILNLKNDMGLADILERKANLIDSIQDMGSNLYVVPSGKTELNSTVLLDSSEMSRVINKAKESFDLIFINCPDLKKYTDPVIISHITDGTVLVLNAGKIKKQVLNIAMAPLRQNKVNIVGVILNEYKHVIPEMIYKLT